MKKLCVFDLDGTLVNSLSDLADAMNHALIKNGFEPHEREEYRSMVGSGVSILADRAVNAPNKAAAPEQKESVLSDFNKYYSEHNLDKTAPYDGIPELLTSLDGLSVKYAVISNKPDVFTKVIIRKLFPAHTFAAAWGKSDRFERKPCPDMLFAMTAGLGIDISECLYIGDSDIDVFTAKNAGMDFCGVSWGFRLESELLNAGAKYIAHKPEDILSML